MTQVVRACHVMVAQINRHVVQCGCVVRRLEERSPSPCVAVSPSATRLFMGPPLSLSRTRSPRPSCGIEIYTTCRAAARLFARSRFRPPIASRSTSAPVMMPPNSGGHCTIASHTNWFIYAPVQTSHSVSECRTHSADGFDSSICMPFIITHKNTRRTAAAHTI